MPLDVPARTTALPVHWVTRGFCRALLAYSNFVEAKRAGNATPLQVHRAAVAQNFFYRLGLDPSPRAPLDQAAKRGLIQLVAVLETVRGNYAKVWAAAMVPGQTRAAADRAADAAVLKPAAIRAMIDQNGADDGIDYLVRAFSSYDQNGTITNKIKMYCSPLGMGRPAGTPLERCNWLSEIEGVLTNELVTAASNDARMGIPAPDYGRIELMPDPDIDFDGYRDAMTNVQNNRPAPIAQYAPAPAAARAGAPLSIYGGVPPPASDVADQARATNYDQIMTPFEEAP